MKTFSRKLFATASILLIPVLSVRGQAPGREISVAVGGMSWDASGTGTAPFAAIRTSGPIAGNWVLAEFSLGYSSLDEQFSDVNTRIGIAEGQVQLQYPARVRPYVGVGGGWLHYFNNAGGGRRTTPQTFSGAAGIRFAVSQRTLLRGELRLRGWESSGGSYNGAAEYTAGIGFAF